VTIWLDNHLSPALARWIELEFAGPCVQVRDLGLARAADRELFDAARLRATSLVTKDRDFAELVAWLGPPPGIILLSCGNTSTAYLRDMMRNQLAEAPRLIRGGEPLVEIGAPR
jgi:predicted nuclease of predicted toxin-antitoxin system